MSLRDTMLNIARRAILDRAALDGYAAEEYDPEEDPEGYVISLLTALRHHCDKYNIDWTTELTRSQELFDEDLQEEEEDQAPAQDASPAAVQSPANDLADKIFTIVCDSDWPEQPDAWPEEAILRALEEIQPSRDVQPTKP